MNKGPFTWYDSQGAHIDTFWTNDRLLGTILKGHIDTLWTKDPLLGTIRKGHIDTCEQGTLSLGRFKKVTGTPCEQRTLYLGRFARVSLIRCVQRTFNTNHMVNVCKSSLKMNHREDWAMISHLLCGHMTRLLETRGNGPMFTLRTHDPSIGSTWQRSHVHFVDTWHFYWIQVATVPCTLCGHMTFLLETRGNGPMYTLWINDISIGNTWQRSHVHFVDTWHFYWKHVAKVPRTL